MLAQLIDVLPNETHRIEAIFAVLELNDVAAIVTDGTDTAMLFVQVFKVFCQLTGKVARFLLCDVQDSFQYQQERAVM